MKFVYLFVAVVLAIASLQNVTGQDVTDECLIPCPLIFMPICGEDANGNQRTFANECILRSENCREKTAFVMKGDGECGE